MKEKIEHIHMRISMVNDAVSNCMVLDGQRSDRPDISLCGILDLIHKELGEVIDYLETEEF